MTSFYYLAKDLLCVVALAAAALYLIPQIETSLYRNIIWVLYGFVQGLLCTGLWVIAHECGHSAFSSSNLVNNLVGWVLHSALLTPFFSCKSSHARHHIYAGHMDKDMVYVPPRRGEYAQTMGVHESDLYELTADAPLVTLLRILMQQWIGWPWYMLTNITAGRDSLGDKESRGWWDNSHIAPTGSLFPQDEFFTIFMSDIGLALTATALWYAGTQLGLGTVFLLYVVPYMWVNHWIGKSNIFIPCYGGADKNRKPI